MGTHTLRVYTEAAHWIDKEFAVRCLLSGIVGTGLLCVSAWAQASGAWSWLDERGQRVFSDTPPPQSVPDHRILQRPAAMPSARGAASANAPTVPSNATPPVPASPTTGATPEDEAKQQALIRQIEAEARAVDKRNAEIRAENCQRAKAALSALASSHRLVTVNEKGQRVTMDQNMRNAERARVEQAIAENCL